MLVGLNLSVTSTITAAIVGNGTVTATGITCPGDCSEAVVTGTVVTLTAAAGAGSVFASWTGCDSVNGTQCTVTVSANRSVTANFSLDPNPPRLINISTRAQVLTGGDVMIAGFIIGGSTPKTVVVRARGPSLAGLVPGHLANPMLQLFSGSTQIAVNDDFGTGCVLPQNACAFAPAHPEESAIAMTLNPGAYTAIVTGVGGTTGVAIVEVFEVDELNTPLINISTRGRVQTDANVMIAGFIVQGSGPQTVVVRARGPSLANLLPGTLADPVLQLFSGSTQIAVNDNWGDASNAAAIQASGFAPSEPGESAVLVTLQPGAYTAIVTGAGGTTGVAIVEVFRN